MLTFERHSRGATDLAELTPNSLIVAGWTGRDEKALHHHIEELAAIGVPRPSSVPVFYRISTANLTQATHLEVLGTDTSGEAEPVVVVMQDGLWLGVGSDHTDRKAETMGIALSKQLCAKMIGKALWRLDEVAGHWDQLILRAYVTIDGVRLKYQEGPLSAMRNPSDLMSRAKADFAAGTLVFCGTLGAIGGIRPATQFTALLEDPGPRSRDELRIQRHCLAGCQLAAGRTRLRKFGSGIRHLGGSPTDVFASTSKLL
jgi:Protein of unknown function (DUF2848)